MTDNTPVPNRHGRFIDQLFKQPAVKLGPELEKLLDHTLDHLMPKELMLDRLMAYAQAHRTTHVMVDIRFEDGYLKAKLIPMPWASQSPPAQGDPGAVPAQGPAADPPA